MPACDYLIDLVPQITKDAVRGLREKLAELAKEAGNSLRELFDNIIEWIRSRDPVRTTMYREGFVTNRPLLLCTE